MPRAPSPPELSPLERTALWVQAQASQAYAADPHPPSPSRSSKTTSSYRTTTSSEETSLKPSLARSSSMNHHSSHPRAPSTTATQRPRYDARSRRSSLPFPQSPPGSGFPVAMEVAAPRRSEGTDRKASDLFRLKLASSRDATRCPQTQTQTPAPAQTQTPRPSLRKQRRPSLIDQIISIGSSSQRRRDEPGPGRKPA